MSLCVVVLMKMCVSGGVDDVRQAILRRSSNARDGAACVRTKRKRIHLVGATIAAAILWRARVVYAFAFWHAPA
eukprot:1217959-Lingulodinium_polyedra.AAC.1